MSLWPHSHNADIVWSWCGEGVAMLYIFEKEKEKEKEIFFDKTKKIFYFCVILDSCTILIDFDPLWLNIGLYMNTVCILDLNPKSVISYSRANPDISL